jgi:hypothetical protein
MIIRLVSLHSTRSARCVLIQTKSVQYMDRKFIYFLQEIPSIYLFFIITFCGCLTGFEPYSPCPETNLATLNYIRGPQYFVICSVCTGSLHQTLLGEFSFGSCWSNIIRPLHATRKSHSMRCLRKQLSEPKYRCVTVH